MIHYKSLSFTNYPAKLNDMFTVRFSSHKLCGNHILALPNPKTTTYGLHAFSYIAGKIWNFRPDTYRTLNSLQFKKDILKQKSLSTVDPVILSSASMILYTV